MMAVEMRGFIAPAYIAALVFHGLFTAFVCVAALSSAVFVSGTANAMRSDLSAFLFILIPPLLGTLPSVIALLSWLMLWRRGRQPSIGHKSLAIGWAAVLLGLIGFGVAME